MPDLSDLYKDNMLNLMLDRLVGGDSGPQQHPEGPMWTNLVRLSDKALHEYEKARSELDQWIAQRQHSVFSPYFRGVDHLENAVTATHRAVLHGRELRKRGLGKRSPQPTVRQENLLKLVRNHIEHTDDKLLKGQIGQGQAIFLLPDEKSLHIGTTSLTYRDLASCIRKIYHQVEAIRGPSK
jgi:hypothetical protein